MEPVPCIYNEWTAAIKGQHLQSEAAGCMERSHLTALHGVVTVCWAENPQLLETRAWRPWSKRTLMHQCITNEKLAWIIDVDIWRVQVQFLLFAYSARVRLAAATNDRCPNWMHSPLLFIRWVFFFFNIWVITSYAQQIRRHTCSKPQTKFLRRHNPASHFKMAPSPKEQPFYVCSPVSHSERSFYSNLILAEWHEPRSEWPFSDICPLPPFFFKQIALFFLFKTTSTGL